MPAARIPPTEEQLDDLGYARRLALRLEQEGHRVADVTVQHAAASDALVDVAADIPARFSLCRRPPRTPAALDRAIEYLARIDYPDQQQEDHEDFAVAEVQVGSLPGWTGRTLAALDLRARYGVTVLAVGKEHEALDAPDPHRALSKHDRVVLGGTREGLQRLKAGGVPSPNEPRTMPS